VQAVQNAVGFAGKFGTRFGAYCLRQIGLPRGDSSVE
jgi:ribosomal protein L37AE/L43A